MSKDIRELAAKAVKAIEKLETACREVNPEYSFIQGNPVPSTTVQFYDVTDSLLDEAFLSQFEEHPYEVTVWIANPYTVTVSAVNSDEACQKIEDNPHGFQYTPKGEYGYSGLTENVLREHPWEPTVE